MNKIIACLAVVAVMGASSAFADEGQVSKNALKAFGLPSLKVVSDEQGMQIRGARSFAFVGGVSSSSLGGRGGRTSTANGYLAGASNYRGSSRANGDSYSISGSYSSGRHGGLTIIGSAGGASAYAR